MQQEACEKHYYLSYDLQLFAKEGQDGEKTEEPDSQKAGRIRQEGTGYAKYRGGYRSNASRIFLYA